MQRMSDSCDEYLSWMIEVRRVQGGTVYRYRKILDTFDEFMAGTSLEDVTSDDIETFLTRTRDNGMTGSPATQKLERSVIGSMFTWATRKGRVTSDPTLMVGIPKVRNTQSKALTDETFRRFWSSELWIDERVMFGLGLFAGLRRAEIMSVQPEQFDLENHKINYLRRKGGSTFGVEYGAAVTTIATKLPHLLSRQEVDEWLNLVADFVTYRMGEKVLTTWDRPASPAIRERYGLLNSWLPDPTVFNKKLTSCQRRIGLPVEHRFSPHALRHTAATNLARAGVQLDVLADVLSHSSTDTTRRYIRGGRLGEWLGNQ